MSWQVSLHPNALRSGLLVTNQLIGSVNFDSYPAPWRLIVSLANCYQTVLYLSAGWEKKNAQQDATNIDIEIV